YLRERLNIGGFLVNVVDTAGIRSTSEHIEEEGVRRSRQVIENADLILFVVDASEPLKVEDYEIWEEIKNRNVLTVCNKMDLPNVLCHRMDGEGIIEISAQTGFGLDKLFEAMQENIRTLIRTTNQDTVVSSLRHRDLLKHTEDALQRSRKAVAEGLSEEFVLLDLHEALRYIGEITGEVTIEDIYSHIFSHFCIGK
ncbi:MAG TPA: GTP-binding protein, partial [Acidobacteriota bacterium]|nr:GTP-binding protein [Acidobacteriota bacterium]